MPRLVLTAALLLAAGCGPAATPAPPPRPAPEALAGGKYEVVGVRDGGAGKMVSESGSRRTNDPVEIRWAVSAAAFEALREGMTLAEARQTLGLAVLAFTPWGEASEFVLVCKQGPAAVTLTFAGVPDVRLKSKSAAGYE